MMEDALAVIGCKCLTASRRLNLILNRKTLVNYLFAKNYLIFIPQM